MLIGFVYGSPNKTKRATLWKALADTLPMARIPWMAVGDFNALLLAEDKKVGNHVGQRCQFFGNFLEDNVWEFFRR